MVRSTSMSEFFGDLEREYGPFRLTVGSAGRAFSAEVRGFVGTEGEYKGVGTANNAKDAVVQAVRSLEVNMALEDVPPAYPCGNDELKERLYNLCEALEEVANEL